MLDEIKKYRLEEKLNPLIFEEEELKKKLLSADELEELDVEKQKNDKLRKNIKNNIFKRIFQKQKYNNLVKRIDDIDEIKIKQFIIEERLIRLKNDKYYLQKEYDSINSIKDLLENDKIGFGIFNFKRDFMKKSCQDLMNYCNEKKIEFLLDKNEWKSIFDILKSKGTDFQYIEKSSKTGIESMSPYVLVHKTNYFPVAGKIITPKGSEMELNNIVLDRIGSIRFKSARNTIHFSVNGEVSSHGYGNWDNCKYAVLIPFKDIPVNQLKCSITVDTYIEGGLCLPKTSYILCPEDEIEIIKKNNPNINVIGYKGKSVSGYADLLVSMLGYEIESIGMWSWGNEKDEKIFKESLMQSGLNVRQTHHSFTKEKFEEDYFIKINEILAFLEVIVQEKKELTEDEIKILSDRYSIFFGTYTFEKEDYFKYYNIFCSNLITFLETNNIDITQQIRAYLNKVHNFLNNGIDIELKNITTKLLEFVFNNVNKYIKDNNISIKI